MHPGQCHWDGQKAAGEEQYVWFELSQDAPGCKETEGKPEKVTRQRFQTHAVHSGGGDGFKRHMRPLHQPGFHAAFPAYPEGLSVILKGLHYGECGIHSASGSAGADQQTH